jgi:hypothetical protein
MSFHIGRSWSGHPLEDECPCPKAPCGLVDVDRTDPACEHHPPERCKTVRQSHPASECPDVKPCECHTFGQCLTSTGCDECRVYGDESCGLPVDPDEES